jgi:hypothetical protein
MGLPPEESKGQERRGEERERRGRGHHRTQEQIRAEEEGGREIIGAEEAILKEVILSAMAV